MRTTHHQQTEALRPPFRFVIRALAAAAALVLGSNASHADDDCRYIDGRWTRGEWLQGGALKGAALSIRDDRWRWGDAHGGAILFCASCPREAVTKGVLRLGLPPFVAPEDERAHRERLEQRSASAVEFALHPENVGLAFWFMTNAAAQALTTPSKPEPFSLGQARGLARLVRTEAQGHAHHGIAVALEDGCFSMFGVFFRDDSTQPLSVDALRPIADALTIHWYTPAGDPAKAVPRAPTVPMDFPLGDARTRREQGLR